MNRLMNPTNKEIWVMSLFYLVVGLLLCFFSVDILTIATRIIGIIFASIGGYMLYNYFGKRTSVDAYPLFVGLPATLIGGLMIFSPESILSILPIVAGIIIIVNSIIQMQKAFVLKDYGYEKWTWALGISVIALAGGVIILSKPIQALSFIFQLVGICFIIEGILLIASERTLKKYE